MHIRPVSIAMICSFLSLSSVAISQTIDFETLPSGAATTDNMLIDAQYEAEYGVRFVLVDRLTGQEIGFPRIAKVGAPLTAFVSCGGDDTPDSGLGVGDSFLTDDGALGNSADLVIKYLSPVSHASGVILDVDARSSDPGAIELWEVRAFSTSGFFITGTVIAAPQGPDEPGCEGFNGEGDGSARGFSFSRPTADIARIQFTYAGSAKLGSVGLAFDNFSPALAIEDLEVELVSSGGVEICQGDSVRLGFSVSGGFSDQDIRWERRLTENGSWEETAEVYIDDDEYEYYPTKHGESIRIVVDDGSVEVASNPITFIVEDVFVGFQGGGATIQNGLLIPATQQSAQEVWGDDPTSFENEEIETVSEGVHILPLHTSEGAHLGVVYNKTGGTTPGTATTEIVTQGFEPEIIHLDDPDDPMYNDTYTEEVLGPGIKRFTFNQTWAGDKTDGFVIGPMSPSGTFTITISKTTGLSTGLFFSGDSEPIPFNFSDGMELVLDSSCGVSCPSDLTGDGSLDFFDVSAFLSAFSLQDTVADFTGDGSYDFFDVSAFLTAFSAGCP